MLLDGARGLKIVALYHLSLIPRPQQPDDWSQESVAGHHIVGKCFLPAINDRIDSFNNIERKTASGVTRMRETAPAGDVYGVNALSFKKLADLNTIFDGI